MIALSDALFKVYPAEHDGSPPHDLAALWYHGYLDRSKFAVDDNGRDLIGLGLPGLLWRRVVVFRYAGPVAARVPDVIVAYTAREALISQLEACASPGKVYMLNEGPGCTMRKAIPSLH